MDESEKNSLANEISDKIKLSRISKRWHDPKQAEFWGGLGWYVSLIVGLMFFGSIVIGSTLNDFNNENLEDQKQTFSIMLGNMDCAALKETLLDLDASDLKWAPAHDVEKQIIARC